MMLGSAQPFPTASQSFSLTRPALPRGFRYSQGAYDQEVIADSTGRIVAGDFGQATVDEWLASKNLIFQQSSSQIIGSYPTNYAAYAALAVLAFLALRGLR